LSYRCVQVDERNCRVVERRASQRDADIVDDVARLDEQVKQLDLELAGLLVLKKPMPSSNMARAIRTILSRDHAKTLWQQRTRLIDKIIEMKYELLQEQEKKKGLKSVVESIEIIDAIISLYNSKRTVQVTIKEPFSTSSHGDRITVGRRSKSDTVGLLDVLRMKQDICARIIMKGLRGKRLRWALQIGIEAILASIKLSASKRLTNELITEQLAKRLERFLGKAFPAADSSRPFSPVLSEAVKAVLYGIIASGLFELVRLFSTMEPGTFHNLSNRMHRWTCDYVQEVGVVGKLRHTSLSRSEVHHLIESVATSLIEQGLHEGLVDTRELLRARVHDLRQRLKLLERKNFDARLEHLMLDDILSFAERVNWVSVGHAWSLAMDFTMPGDYDKHNVVVSLGSQYAENVVRIAGMLQMVEDVVSHPSKARKIYERTFEPT